MDIHMHLLFWIWMVILHEGASTSESNEPQVNVPGHGVFKGTILTTAKGNKMHGFLGIPYAKPPIGDLRFKEPQPPEPFDGIWDSTYLREMCIQHRHIYPEGHDQVYGQEDCLHLNIYVPKTPSSKKKSLMDVLIVIHGGCFMWGTGQYYGPDFIIDRDVIVVNINYRLGPLGFLSLEDEIAPGNNGLKDQVAALKWVNKNIEYFGGNPKSIHLTGLSAGGASVHFHYLSPLSRGLFKRGISVSGTALCPWALVDKPREKALKLAAITGCPTTSDSSAILKCLRQRPARDLVSAMSHFQVWMYNPFSPFGPVVEHKGLPNKAFLPDNPFNLLSNGQFLQEPWITSVTEHEGLYPAAGVAHGDDIAYAIGLTYIKPFEAKDKPISDLLLDFYTSFIQKGKPVSKGVSWEKIQPKKDSVDYLFIVSPSNITMAYSNDFGNEKFWNSLGLREDHNLKKYHEEL